jgi:UDP-glucose 4-epimerase
MTKKVFITGIAGLIGSNLAKYYIRKGWYVAGCDNLIGGYFSNVPKTASFYDIDILKTEELTQALLNSSRNYESGLYDWKESFDVVIHCAALAYEGLSVFSPSLVTNNIYGGTVSVATAAITAKAKLFINCSSMARYGELTPPFTEDMVCKPVDPYGMAKYHAEEQLKLLSEIYPEFKYYTVVPHNVSGAQQVYTDPYRNVLSIMINQALSGRPIYIYGDGKQQRSFSHVDDCVKAIDVIVEKQPEQKLFNIGPDFNEITINDLALKVLSQTKSRSRVIWLDPRPREVKNAWCSSKLAAEILNYEAVKSVDDIITDIVDYIMLNGTSKFNYKLPIQIANNKPIPRTWGPERLFNKYLEETNEYSTKEPSSN